jgi:high-affinity nickel-transport protein
MINFLSIIALGFFLGMRHATDPDHVIAVSTIVSRQRGILKGALMGAFWGLGHTLTIFIVGAAIIWFQIVIPARVGLSMELSVGLMLIVLGAFNVVSFTRSIPSTADSSEGFVHSHPHRHGGFVHSHSHGHNPERHSHDDFATKKLDSCAARIAGYKQIRPLLIGIVHGLAGSAAVALLVLVTIHDPRWAIAYLLVFGLGTIAGMVIITAAMSSAFRLVKTQQVFRRLTLASGVLSLAFGVIVAYQICFRAGLLTTGPHWVPR